MTKGGVLACCMVAAVTMASGQGGSNYSALGLGDQRLWVGALYDAMSGTSIGMPTPHGINTVNPALLGYAPTTRIQAGYRFNQAVISNGDASLAQNNGSLDGLIAMFSIDTARGFGISLGVLPYSKVAYRITRNLSTDVNGATVAGTSTQQGEGGVSQLQIGASVRLFGSLRVGVQFAGLFGVQKFSDHVRLDGIYSDVYSSQSYDTRGLLAKGALYWEIADGAGIGAFVCGGSNGSVYTTREAQGVASGNFFYDTSEVVQSTTPMPFQAGIGGSVRVGTGRLGADLRIADYTAVTIHQRPDAEYTTSLRISAAYANDGSQSPAASFWQRIGWYSGIGFERLYVTYKGEDIVEYNASVGTSFPLGGQAMVDAALVTGMRGVQSFSGIVEWFGRLTFTLSIGEIWFKPFVRD